MKGAGPIETRELVLAGASSAEEVGMRARAGQVTASSSIA